MAKAGLDKGKGKAVQMPGAVRSRRGCLVCRRRHKKCDEQFEDGSCERCRAAGLECLLPPVENRTRYSGPTYKSGRRQAKSASPVAVSSSGMASEAHSPDDSEKSSQSPIAGPSTYAGAPAASLVVAPASPASTFDDAMDGLPLIVSSSSPSALAPAASSTLAILGSTLADIPPTSTWDPFSDCFATPRAIADAQQPASPGAYLRSWVGSGTSSATDFLRSIQPWADAAFAHLPPSHFGAASTQLAISALSRKYVSPDTRLTQDIYNMIHTTWLNLPHKPTYFSAMSARSGTSKLARDLVVKAFEELVPSEPGAPEGLLEAGFLYDQAVQRLVSCNEMPLEDRMHIISDLQLYSFATSGAKQAYEAVGLADNYFRALGNEEQIAAYLHATLIDTKDEAAVKLFVSMDLCRSIARPGTRPLLPRLMLYATAAENEAAHLVIFPYELAVVLSQICHLQVATLSPSETEAEMAAMELDILLVNEDRAPRPWIIRIWKLAVRALFYQRIRRVGPLHPVLQAIGADLTHEFGRYKPGESAIEKSLALPLFLTGSLAISRSDRDAVQARWATLKPERGWQEPIALLRRMWAEMDETGDSIRWDDVVLNEGWPITFF